MKTLFLLLAVAVLVLSMPTVSYAGDERAAVVINRGTGLCGMPGADANGDFVFGGVGYAKVVLENSNKIS